eukprot:768388-Hanusia_phi.AAC.3
MALTRPMSESCLQHHFKPKCQISIDDHLVQEENEFDIFDDDLSWMPAVHKSEIKKEEETQFAPPQQFRRRPRSTPAADVQLTEQQMASGRMSPIMRHRMRKMFPEEFGGLKRSSSDSMLSTNSELFRRSRNRQIGQEISISEEAKPAPSINRFVLQKSSISS